jgi:DNA-directed RNA polymerase subunit RPC12/RpoP
MTDPPWWMHAIHTYPCPTCGAQPEQPCTTRTGNPTNQPHAQRGNTHHRCTTCHQLLPHNQDPADNLCTKCNLVQTLEIERATYHQRNQ